jgi:hypothetical protein
MSLQVGPMMPDVDPTTENQMQPSRVRWVPWAIGAALLAALIAAVSQLAEEREFAQLVESAQPGCQGGVSGGL